MVKRTQQSARETKQEDKDGSKAKNGLCASCSFSSPGLDPKLSDPAPRKDGFLRLVRLHKLNLFLLFILSGRDVLVNAATGTGKTVAYLAPIIHHLQGYSLPSVGDCADTGVRNLGEAAASFPLDCPWLCDGRREKRLKEKGYVKESSEGLSWEIMAQYDVGAVIC